MIQRKTKDSTKNRTNEFSKSTGCKINIQKSFVFLHTNKLSEREIKKTIPLTMTSKNKITRNKFNQDGERHISWKDIDEINWERHMSMEKIFHAHIIEELVESKCLHYPKQSINSMQFLSKFQWHFLQN